ncbi:hypothetical protein O181_084046 [Austropuccinia psidii MF-1]|uniref:Uncharacterized protein n=1 Tax=Austropuccinia psidii MF-1 TaxID=1389203 RepID=A0A9Q3IIG8_9BASI|nr:hypothetical protein [Austropuccinia psidii MF-1]
MCSTTVDHQTIMQKILQNKKKKIYAIDEKSEEEPVGDRSDSEQMGSGIKAYSQSESESIEEYIVECNEKISLYIQDIELDSGIPQVTTDKEHCKHTQDEQKFVVKPN